MALAVLGKREPQVIKVCWGNRDLFQAAPLLISPLQQAAFIKLWDYLGGCKLDLPLLRVPSAGEFLFGGLLRRGRPVMEGVLMRRY